MNMFLHVVQYLGFLRNFGRTLIDAPAGVCHSAHSGVMALEKGTAISCEPCLAMNRMTNSHSHRLNVTVH